MAEPPKISFNGGEFEAEITSFSFKISNKLPPSSPKALLKPGKLTIKMLLYPIIRWSGGRTLAPESERMN